MRSFTTFTWYGKSRHPQHYRCTEACGGSYRMGVNGAHNTVEGNVGAYNTVCVRAVVEYCSCRCTGYGPWYRGLTCALPFSFAPGSFRAGVPGRMAPVGSGHASRRRAVSRVPANPGRRRGVGVGSSAWAWPSDRRGRSEVAGVRSERSGRRGGPKQPMRGRCFFSASPSGR